MKSAEFDFNESLNYPSKNFRELANAPISVPRDPLIEDFTPIKGKTANPENFSYSLYLTAFDIRDYGNKIDFFIEIFEHLNLKKIYLEVYRDGYAADLNLVVYAKDTLEEAGYKVAGAVTTTHFSERAKYNESISASGCYSDKRANEKMAALFSSTAEIFNEIIIDDWFFTICRCHECSKSRHEKTWAEHRCEIMAHAARKYMVEPAKAANHSVKLILKLPQWFENWQDNGYDIKKLAPLFDELAVGVETRDPKRTRFMPAAGGMLFGYVKELGGERTKRAWFDAYISGDKIFSEQAYQAVLSGAREIILFCAGYLPLERVRPLVERLIADTPAIDAAAKYSGIFTVPMVRKHGAAGEEKLHQYLRMLGIPAYLTEKHDFTPKIAVLTEQSARKKEYNSVMKEMMDKKKEIVVTPGFAVNAGRYIEVEKLAQPFKVSELSVGKKVFKVKDNIFIEYRPAPVKNMQVLIFSRGYPGACKNDCGKRTIWFLNLPVSKDRLKDHAGNDMPADYRYLLSLPEQVINAIKSVFKPYAELNKYDKIKMLYKHEI